MCIIYEVRVIFHPFGHRALESGKLTEKLTIAASFARSKRGLAANVPNQPVLEGPVLYHVLKNLKNESSSPKLAKCAAQQLVQH